MLNTKKLLYILPDAAYIAELLPGKKPHAFVIQAFRQINGNFIDDNEFIAENVEKLIKKIDVDEYHIILPDFLFTNTIVDIAQSSEAEVKKYLLETLLPSLNLTKETHNLDTFILTQHQGKFKVQLSALEKSLLAPIQKAVEEQHITITAISPLSWTIKSVISLEPSLSTIQIGSMLYLAQHYIGIDQTISFKIEESANIIETVKTLKGGEPNIQTMYLLTNALIESDIKEKLSGTLPIQQLSNFADEQEGIPSYMKHLIEAAAKTFDIADYPVPRFPIGKYVAPAVTESAPATAAVPIVAAEKEESMPASKLPIKSLSLDDEAAPLPAPTAAPAAPVVTTAATPPLVMHTTPPLPDVNIGTSPVVPPASVPTATPIQPIVTTPAPSTVTTPSTPVAPIAPVATAPSLLPHVQSTPAVSAVQPLKVAPPTQTANVVPFSYPTMNTPLQPQAPAMNRPGQAAPMSPGMGQTNQSGVGFASPPKKVIKNKGGAGSLVKVVGITLAALIVTVAIGIAIGFAILTLSEKKAPANFTPVVQVSPLPTVQPTVAPTPIATASATPTPSPTPKGKTATKTTTTDKTTATTGTSSTTSLKILIVNATKIAGKAGKIKSTLTAAGYTSVDTGNAKGTYTAGQGTLLLMSTQDPATLSSLQTDSKQTLTAKSGKATEDPSGSYDAVLVLTD